MYTQAEMDERIWMMLDGEANPQETQLIRQLVNSDAAWKARHDELLSLHHSLQQDMELMQPSLRFTKNVMDQIAAISMQSTARSYLNNKIVYGIGGLFVALISIAILYAIAAVDWAAGGSSFRLPEQANVVGNWSGWLNGPITTIGAIAFSVIGIALLDQYLRPKMLHKKH